MESLTLNLQRNYKIKSQLINLGNEITDDGCDYIADIIRKSHSIYKFHLNLSYNKI